jgi:hypothetical protein
MAEMGRIIEVVRSFIPSERWPDVQAALRAETPVRRGHQRLAINTPAPQPNSSQ